MLHSERVCSTTSTPHVRNSFGQHSVIVNEKPLNLEKTTSTVLFVLILIYGAHQP